MPAAMVEDVVKALRNSRSSLQVRDCSRMCIPAPACIYRTYNILYSTPRSPAKPSIARVQDAALENRVRAPSLTTFRWRVDVAISTETLQKVFKPTVLCETTTSDGVTKTFEMPVEQFHSLRYNVAKVLRNMVEVERHPIMRLAFQSDREAFDEGGGKE